ncbi:hypothetical protein, partial [Burkholderia sp. SIMBA_052]
PQRSVAHTPLFQAMFNYVEENDAAHGAPFALPGLTVRTLAGTAGSAQVDLALDVAAQGGHIQLALTYASDVFDAATVE